ISANDQKGAFLFHPSRNPADAPPTELYGTKVVRSSQISNTRTKGSATNLTYIVLGFFPDWIVARLGVMEVPGQRFRRYGPAKRSNVPARYPAHRRWPTQPRQLCAVRSISRRLTRCLVFGPTFATDSVLNFAHDDRPLPTTSIHLGVSTMSTHIDDFKNEVTRNYAVALQEKAQRIINNFIEVKVAELSKSYKSGYEDYKVLPKFLDRATALLGESHYFYKNLKSNQYLFEAFAMQYEGFGIFDSVRIRKNLNLYKKSLEYNDKNPLTLYFISKYYAGKLHDRDSCDIYFKKLTEVATTWVMAYAQHADNLVRYFKDFEQAKSTVLEGWAIDSTNTYLIKALANIYFYQKQYAKAIQKYRDAERLDSSDVLTYVNLAACYTMTGEDSLAIVNYEKSIKMDSTLMVVYMNYGWLYFKHKDYDNAERIFLKGVNLRNEYVPVKGRLCQVYLAQNKLGKVKEQLKLIKAIYPDDWRYYLYSACIEAKKGQDNKALELLRKAMKSDGFDDMRTVEDSGYFEKLKKDGRLAKLIEEVFEK
ncbi:MAG TPA: tetratricopeptide repeat protein, partial [Saprospiraceae bacterium]|nr:tetratricopeptide repeat protein [Saprospiraceae bacterium]